MQDLRNITPEAIEELEELNDVKPASKTTDFNIKNYLNVRLSDGEKSRETKIRILPISKDSTKWYEIIYMHTIKLKPEQIQKGGSEWKSYVCLKNTEGPFSETLGHKCPFCEQSWDAHVKETEATNDIDKKRYHDLAKSYMPSKVAILRCIERGENEKDGPKYLKVNMHNDNSDLRGLIYQLYADRKQESIDIAKDENNGVLPEGFAPENILDLINGKDLKLTITKGSDNKTSISVVDYGKNKPLSPNVDQINEWCDDPKVWYDVFVPKPYDYSSLIIDGKKPFFDRTVQKWVAWVDKKEEQKAEVKAADDKVKEAEEAALNITPVARPAEVKPVEVKSAPQAYVEETEEELPF